MDIGHGKTVIFDPNKMNLFVLSGHGSESFAAFLNGVILQKQRGSESQRHKSRDNLTFIQTLKHYRDVL